MFDSRQGSCQTRRQGLAPCRSGADGGSGNVFCIHARDNLFVTSTKLTLKLRYFQPKASLLLLAFHSLSALHIVIHVSDTTLSTVVPVLVLGHEGSDSGNGGVLAEALDLSGLVDAVVFKGLHGDGLVNALHLLGLGVGLLLPLLSSAPQPQHEVKGALLLDIVVAKCPSILELLSGEDKTLLIRGDSLLVLDFLLDIVDGVGRLDIQGDGFPCEGLDKDLHVYILWCDGDFVSVCVRARLSLCVRG